MDISSCLTNRFYFIILVLAILKGVIVYSVGRTHCETSGFELHMPSLMEWITIIVLITVLYLIGTMILIGTVGEENVRKLMQI